MRQNLAGDCVTVADLRTKLAGLDPDLPILVGVGPGYEEASITVVDNVRPAFITHRWVNEHEPSRQYRAVVLTGFNP